MNILMDTTACFYCACLLAVSFLAPLDATGYSPKAGKGESKTRKAAYKTDEIGWTISEEIFYWIGHEQGLGYTNNPANVLTTDNFTQNSVIKPSFQWEWGFRLGACFKQYDHPWTYQGYWTYLQSKARGNRSVNSGAPDFLGMFPIWSMNPGTLAGDYVSSASESWQLHGDLLDFAFQYSSPFLHRNPFSLMPLVGLRGAVLNQKLTANYSGGTFFSGVDGNSLQCRFLGGGPRFGFNGNCELPLGFSLFGRAAVAPLFGYSRIQQNETYLGNQRFHRSKIDHHLLLSADIEAGFRWKGSVIDNRAYLILGLAWEAQEFCYVNRFYRGPYGFFKKNRDLFLQGLTASAALEF